YAPLIIDLAAERIRMGQYTLDTIFMLWGEPKAHEGLRIRIEFFFGPIDAADKAIVYRIPLMQAQYILL
ncbi:MAG: hypothetical protein ACYTHJ_06235, partial [Planctomycetota bacterium]